MRSTTPGAACDPKPVLRGWLHLLWFEASLVGGTLLLARAHGARQITAVAIYAASVTGLFGISALYHRGNWGPLRASLAAAPGPRDDLLADRRHRNRRFPARRPQSLCSGRPECAVGLTLAAIVTHLVWMNAPEKLVGAIFIGLGWTAGMAAPQYGSMPASRPGIPDAGRRRALHRRRAVLLPPLADPVPAVFGFHEVFHAYVCAAAACQYIAISLLI